MKKIFVKLNSSRAKKFQLKTFIVLNGEDKLVIKEASSSVANEHLLNMYNSQKELSSAYPHLDICEAALVDGTLHFKYINGYSLTKMFLDAMQKNDKEAFWKLVDFHVSLICPQKRDCAFIQTDEFIKIFGNRYELEGTAAFSAYAFDITCNNIILRNSQKAVLIDYEWFWNFPIPKDFLIFHCIYSMYFIFPEFELFISFKDIADYLGIKDKLLIFLEMHKSMHFYFNNDCGIETSEEYILSRYLKCAIHVDENKGYLENAVAWHNENKAKMEQAIAWHNENKAKMEQAIAWHNENKAKMEQAIAWHNENKAKMEQAIAWHNQHEEQLKSLADEKENEYQMNLNEVKDQRSKLRAIVFEMENSLSWRITKVLRKRKK